MLPHTERLKTPSNVIPTRTFPFAQSSPYPAHRHHDQADRNLPPVRSSSYGAPDSRRAFPRCAARSPSGLSNGRLMSIARVPTMGAGLCNCKAARLVQRNALVLRRNRRLGETLMGGGGGRRIRVHQRAYERGRAFAHDPFLPGETETTGATERGVERREALMVLHRQVRAVRGKE